MANNVTREEHLEALASAIKTYTDSQLANVGGSSYTLPVAGASTLGGVKVGTGLVMDGDTLNCTISGGQSYSEATTLTAGLMSATDKAKLDNVANNANNYTLPTASTSTKGGVIIGAGLSMSGDTLNCTIESTSSTTVFTGATGLAGGASGLVPAPSAGDNEKFLRGDGQWATVQGGGETYSEATTLTSGLMSATDKAKLDNISANANNYTLPTASTSTKGGIKPGTGLVMNGDTLNCTITGGSGGGGTAITLSNTASTVNGALWLDSTVATTAGAAVTLSTLMPATVVNGSMWLEV